MSEGLDIVVAACKAANTVVQAIIIFGRSVMLVMYSICTCVQLFVMPKKFSKMVYH